MNSWIELDLNRLSSNIEKLRTAIGPSTEIMFVVKANAYGHSVVPVAQCAWSSGVRWYVVAHVCEAVELRKVLPEASILVVGAINPAHAKECVEGRFVPVITSLKHGREIASALSDSSGTLECHAKIDTGMGRLGIAWEEAGSVLAALASESKLAVKGICTHFASSVEESRSFFDAQCERFEQVLAAAAAAGIQFEFKHASNSGAISLAPDVDMDGVRPGIMLYGYGAMKSARDLQMEPVLQWKTRVVQVKSVPADFPVSYDSTYVTKSETCLVTVDVGYSDGYPRSLSNCGHVLIGGKRMPVVGNVTMNLLIVDAGNDVSVEEGDEVVLIGKQGDEELWADEVASASGILYYDLLTGIRAGKVKVVA